MAKGDPIVIDFETYAIEPRPFYPPRPVGVSLWLPEWKAPRYYAWGHPTGGNNCNEEDVRRILTDIWEVRKEPLLFHNAKFDIDVMQTHLGVGPIRNPLRLEDTLFQLFLTDPHQPNMSLKPSAERLLGMPPEERDAVFDWLKAHQADLKLAGLLPANVNITPKSAGAYIALAPADVVGPYANGDTLRTKKLHHLLLKELRERGMMAPYEREKRLMPILLQNEREGMRVDLPALEAALVTYESAMATVEGWLRKRLKSRDLDFEKDVDVGNALEAAGVVREWAFTATGQKSVSKHNLKRSQYNDERVFLALGYRNRLATCLSTFMRPWLRVARETGGWIHTNWNQVRQSRGNDNVGARTGRTSTNPNFQNIAKNFEGKDDGYEHPAFIKGLPPLPLLRRFILPDKPSHWIGRRDYNQQELRILAHFENGTLMEAYNQNPRLDVHRFVQEKILEVLGLELHRTPVKTINFGFIYGQGVGSLAEKLEKTVEEVQTIRKAQLTAVPGLLELDKDIKSRGRNGGYITTWGGRQYYAEPPAIINGVERTFEYKLLNYLIQGSAADCTKEAIIRYHDMPGKVGRFMVQVHDEIDISCPKKELKAEMLRLREAMMSVEFDVPMLSDAEYGPNWAELRALQEPPYQAKE